MLTLSFAKVRLGLHLLSPLHIFYHGTTYSGTYGTYYRPRAYIVTVVKFLF